MELEYNAKTLVEFIHLFNDFMNTRAEFYVRESGIHFSKINRSPTCMLVAGSSISQPHALSSYEFNYSGARTDEVCPVACEFRTTRQKQAALIEHLELYQKILHSNFMQFVSQSQNIQSALKIFDNKNFGYFEGKWCAPKIEYEGRYEAKDLVLIGAVCKSLLLFKYYENFGPELIRETNLLKGLGKRLLYPSKIKNAAKKIIHFLDATSIDSDSKIRVLKKISEGKPNFSSDSDMRAHLKVSFLADPLSQVQLRKLFVIDLYSQLNFRLFANRTETYRCPPEIIRMLAGVIGYSDLDDRGAQRYAKVLEEPETKYSHRALLDRLMLRSKHENIVHFFD